MDSETPNEDASGKETTESRQDMAATERTEDRARPEGRMGLAILGGFIGAAIGAALWAAVAVATGQRVIWMAIVAGVAAGYATRLLGKGTDASYGGIGALFALLGCLSGNLLMFCDMAARQTNMSFSYILRDLDPVVVVEMFQQGFRASDLAFYAVALIVAFFLGFSRCRAA